MIYEVIDLLEDVAITIYNSKYSDHITLIDGYALMSRLNDEFRRTKDLDFNVDSIEVWNEFCEKVEELLNKESQLNVKYKLLKRKGRKGDSSDRLWLEGDGIKFTLDMNIRNTFAVVNMDSLLRKGRT